MTDPRELLSLFMVALCVWREARGESLRGKLLVAQTIKNRVLDPRWPKTYVGVVTQRRQFSSFNADDPNAVLFPSDKDEAWVDCVAMTDQVLMTDTPMTTANHYHSLGVMPDWAREDKIVAREGRHIFYEL